MLQTKEVDTRSREYCDTHDGSSEDPSMIPETTVASGPVPQHLMKGVDVFHEQRFPQAPRSGYLTLDLSSSSDLRCCWRRLKTERRRIRWKSVGEGEVRKGLDGRGWFLTGTITPGDD
ncbi:hypothetical protein DY000_02047298 [Brassica cretica]|uniref:Uncharacterized protein n=1 Tax=Brassica cretica TaxID=69181 RepID=A0ABQ7F2W3_BRACR|nr:hypothetical protein DY000_02047298 [Brassica cretica]